jgi:pimeloyl-ACP methyl ester carboxylesterase
MSSDRTPAGFTHKTLPTPGSRLHYVQGGTGPTILLLHGWPQNWSEWRHVMPDLAKDHTVIAPDWRGAGSSGRPQSGYDANSIAEELKILVDHVDNGPVTIVGHDWGAAFGYAYAATYRDDVEALAIFEMVLPGLGIMEGAMTPQPGGNFLWHMAFQSVPDMPAMLIAGHEREYLQWFFQHFAYDPSAITPEDLDEYTANMTQVGAQRAGLAVYQEYFTSAAQVVEHAKVPLTIPTVAFGGEACLGPATLMSVEMVAPKATGGVVERSGHWMPEERPDAIIEHVRSLAN